MRAINTGERSRPCTGCGRSVIEFQLFGATIMVEADRPCVQVAIDPATLRELVQEAPKAFAVHECPAATATPRQRVG